MGAGRVMDRGPERPVCAWATRTSLGMIVPVPRDGSPAGVRHPASEVAEVMRRIRQDVED
jgi:hypothetical protein